MRPRGPARVSVGYIPAGSNRGEGDEVVGDARILSRPDDGTDGAVRPPKALALAAVATALVAIALLFGHGTRLHAVGYLLGSPLCVLIVVVYRRVDLGRRQSSTYIGQRSIGAVATAALLCGLLASSVHVWHFATALSK